MTPRGEEVFNMRVLIGRTFKYEKEDKIFQRGRNYLVKKELGEFIARKRLGVIIPEVKTDKEGKPTLKDLKGPPKDRMMRTNDIKTK